MSCDRGFREWLTESVVKGSMAGEAMKRTLDFKVDAEWIEWKVEPKGWISDRGVKDSFDLRAAFHNPKVAKPAFFYIRAHAILDRPDAEYDSLKGGGDMKIFATIFLFNGKTGLGGAGGTPRSMRGMLDAHGHIRLSERGDNINFPGALSEFDGPALRTPLDLATWINRVVGHTDIRGNDDGEDGPETPDVPNPIGGRLVGV